MSNSVGRRPRRSRREVLKLAGAAGVAGLVGYSGTGCAAAKEAALGSGPKMRASGPSLSGVKIQFWDMQHTRSAAAASLLEEAIAAVEERTGATIVPTWGSWNDNAGGRWKQNVASGNRPTVLQGTQEIHGQYVAEGWFKPVDDYLDEFSDETADAIGPTLAAFETAYSGFDPAQVYEMPLGTEIGSTFLARVDHFEEAGVDVDREFPPTSYDDLVQLATTLQENGPGSHGFQIYGSADDVVDGAPLTWAVSESGNEGAYLNEAWTDVTYDSSAWKTALSRWVRAFREHELSSPTSPSASDETATELLIRGDASLTQVSGVNHAIIESSAPRLVENEAIRYGPHWDGSGSVPFVSPSQGILVPGQNDDPQAWSRKQQVVYELQRELLSRDRQRQLTAAFAIPPTRTDVFDDVRDDAHRSIDAQIRMRERAGDGMLAWEAHPEMAQIKREFAGLIFQDAVSGETDPAVACEQAANYVRSRVGLTGGYPVPGQ